MTPGAAKKRTKKGRKTGARRNGAGTSFDVTDRDRMQVRTLVGMGIKRTDIATLMGFSVSTLIRHFQKELETGDIEANARVAESLFKKAMGEGRGAVTAAIFWLKCRAGWREVNTHEHVGAGGGPIEVDDARTELLGLVAKHQKAVLRAAEQAAEMDDANIGSDDAHQIPRMTPVHGRKIQVPRKPQG